MFSGTGHSGYCGGIEVLRNRVFSGTGHSGYCGGTGSSLNWATADTVVLEFEVLRNRVFSGTGHSGYC